MTQPFSEMYHGTTLELDHDELRKQHHNAHEIRWFRQPGESWQAYEAFAWYRDLGPGRNHAKTAEKVGKSLQMMRTWSARWDWLDRAASFDANEEWERMVRFKESRFKMLENDARTARVVKNKVIQRLNQLKPEELTPTQLIHWWEVAFKVERMSLGATGEFPGMEAGPPQLPELESLETAMEDPEVANAAAKLIEAARNARSVG